MMSRRSRSFISILIAVLFLATGSLDLAAAKSSSFGGGSRSSSSSSFSRGSSSSPSSSSGWGSSKSSPSSSSSSGWGSTSSPKPSGGSSGGWSLFGSGSKSSDSGGFKTSTPGSVSTPPASAPKSTFTNSSGATASETPKSGSAFSSRVNEGINKNAASTGTTTGSPSGGWGWSNKQTTTSVPSSRTTIIYRDRPSGWTPQYYGGGYGGSPASDFIDIWWKMEMLKAVTNQHERDQISRDIKSDPNYERWRKEEAEKLSKENADLKAQLAAVDNSGNVVQTATPVETAPVKKKSSWSWFWWLLGLGSLGGAAWWFVRRK